MDYSDSSNEEDINYDSDKDKEYHPDSSTGDSEQTDIEEHNLSDAEAGDIIEGPVEQNAGNPADQAESPFLKRSRKRQRKPNTWKQATAKRLRNSGHPYTNRRGMVVAGKKFVNLDCHCKKKCIEHFSEDERRTIFDFFWKMGDFGKQNAYLSGLVHQIPIKCRRPRDKSKNEKICSYVYHLQKHDSTVKVCKKFFINTFGMTSDGRVLRALQKIRNEHTPGEDLRGKNVPATKISDVQKQAVIDHINRFPAYEGHYTRKDNPNRKFLNPELNIRKMYELYVAITTEQNKEPVKEHYYRYIFNTEFNLHFHTPRKDTCKTCDKYQQLSSIEDDPQKKAELKVNHEIHLRRAEKARSALNGDALKSKNEDNICTLTFDLQKALPFPKLSVSEAYYRRNMYVYNLGIHNLGNGTGVMHVWDECIASRGSQEIASCIRKYIKTTAGDKSHIILFSDACTGQNRNLKVALSLMKLTQEDDTAVELIDHKFMVSGHSFLPNDADFGLIEKQAKTQTIYVPDHWYETIIKARKKKKFLVVQMQPDDFLSTESLEQSVTKRKKNINNDPVNWLKIQWLRYDKKKPFTIQYKLHLDEDWPFSELNLTPNKDGRPRLLKNIEQKKLFQESRVINYLKKRDMLYLLKYIPPVHHRYFRNIRASNEVEDTGPLSEEDEE